MTFSVYVASERLAEAESQASADHRSAQRDSHAYRSAIYPPGSEFALCHAQSQLMGAVVGVLNESLTESIKGFYKLRKAYITLDGILEAEIRYMRARSGLGNKTPAKRSFDSLGSSSSAASTSGIPGGFDDAKKSKKTVQVLKIQDHEKLKANSSQSLDAIVAKEKDRVHDSGDDDDDDEFFDAGEDTNAPVPAVYTGHVELHGSSGKLAQLSFSSDNSHDPKNLPLSNSLSAQSEVLFHDPDSDIFANPIDVFIHTGANLCFGMMLILISMIPPAFSRLLSIVGFRGDRERGLRLLWQASKFHNVNGAMSGLMLLGYYNTIIGFSDIIPDPDLSPHGDVGGYPKKRCEALLAEMRHRHPKSCLWILEEARMHAANRDLSAAMALLSKSTKSPLKQVEALDMFEKSLNAMYMHDYGLCSTSFLNCIALNNWSHALYYYIAGAAHVEQYRSLKPKSPEVAAIHAKKAIELLKEAPKHSGKKKFMARQLPFDSFVVRKINKWEQRAHERNIEFIDAIGVSPIEEMIYLWNGHKRMNPSQLEASLGALAWSESSPAWARETSDERGIHSFVRAVVFRNLDEWDKATELLKTGILRIDKTELKGGLKDDWIAPAAHYEMGVICWMRRKGPGIDQERSWVKECETWVEKAAKWESYELDARIGIKIATAQDALKKWKEDRTSK